jgi:hypothetical protein
MRNFPKAYRAQLLRLVDDLYLMRTHVVSMCEESSSEQNLRAMLRQLDAARRSLRNAILAYKELTNEGKQEEPLRTGLDALQAGARAAKPMLASYTPSVGRLQREADTRHRPVPRNRGRTREQE